MSRLFHILLLAAVLVGAFQGNVLAQDVARGESEQPVAVHEAGVPTARALQPVEVVLHPVPVSEQRVPGGSGTSSHLFPSGTASPGFAASPCRTAETWLSSRPLYELLHVYRC